MSYVTLKDVQKAFEPFPVVSNNHRFYVFVSGCGEHLNTLRLTCSRCRVGRWSPIPDSDILRIHIENANKEVRENKRMSKCTNPYCYAGQIEVFQPATEKEPAGFRSVVCPDCKGDWKEEEEIPPIPEQPERFEVGDDDDLPF